MIAAKIMALIPKEEEAQRAQEGGDFVRGGAFGSGKVTSCPGLPIQAHRLTLTAQQWTSKSSPSRVLVCAVSYGQITLTTN